MREELWDAVQKRFQGRSKAVGRPSRGRPVRHLFSGLMKCSCGSNIVVLTSHRNRRAEYGCPRFRNRGEVTCDNHAVAKEPSLGAALLDFVRLKLLSPDAVEYAVRTFNQRLRERLQTGAPNARVKALEQQIGRLEQEVARYVAAIGQSTGIEKLVRALEDRKARLEDAHRELAALRSPLKAFSPIRWSRQDVEKRIENLHADLASGDVSKARRVLSGVLGPIDVRLLRRRKNPVWKLSFHAQPLTVLLGDLGSYKCGSGGPL